MKTIDRIRQVGALSYIAGVALYGRAAAWAKKTWGMLLALVGLSLIGCAPSYRVLPVDGHQAVEIQCYQPYECNQVAEASCPDGRFVSLARTSTSLVFQCAEVSNDTSHAIRRVY